MMKNDPMATGKKANTPEKYEPIELLAAVTTITQNVTTAARHARSAPESFDALDRAGDAKVAGGKNRDRIDNGVEYDRACGVPVEQPQQEHAAKPDQERAPEADPQ